MIVMQQIAKTKKAAKPQNMEALNFAASIIPGVPLDVSSLDEAIEEIEAAERADERLKDHTLMILTRARQILDLGYVIGDLSQDKNGSTVHPTDEAAVRFCAVGSVLRASHELYADIDYDAIVSWDNNGGHLGTSMARDLLDMAAKTLYRKAKVYFVNDNYTKQETLNCFDWAIAERKKGLGIG